MTALPDLGQFASDLVSVVSAHRREHGCGRSGYCEEERQIVEAAKADVVRALLPTVYADAALIEAAARAVKSQKLDHCARALFYSRGFTSGPWALLAYDERQRYLREASVVLDAADEFIGMRRV